MSSLSKTSVDQLGERLRRGNVSEGDLRLLDTYRRSFSRSYEMVIATIRTTVGLAPTGRPAKSTTSITEKLQRETIRLTQMQDIAGCRLVVRDIEAQDATVEALKRVFSSLDVIDRRLHPSHGYRAVHLIATVELMRSRYAQLSSTCGRSFLRSYLTLLTLPSSTVAGRQR